MKIKLGGVRGSIPTTDPAMAYYGGNTSCAQVSEDGFQLLLDGGSGIQRLASVDQGISTNRIDILLTHLHIDHIQGLGFFKPLFDADREVHVWGPGSSSHTLHSRLSRYLSEPLFPVGIRDLPCRLILHDIENSSFEIGPFTVQSSFVIHPGPTLGYRINGKHSSFTYLPDHEPALGRDGIIADEKWISGFDLAHNTDLLLHDAQYSELEYQSKKGWGHTSFEDAARFALMTCAKHLLLAHHDPSRKDAQLNELFAAFKKQTHYSFHVELAREGVEFTLK